MRNNLPDIPDFDYTVGVIDGLKWCLNCGIVASAEEICAQIKKLTILQEDSLREMEADFNKSAQESMVNNTYDIIIDQILETFPNACHIVKRGIYKESAVVEFSPYEGATPYSATLFTGQDKVVIAVIL